MRRLAAVASSAFAAATVGCSSSTAPATSTGSAKIAVVGAGQSDTIQATLPTLLTVQVTGSGAAGAIVQFVSGDSTGAFVAPPTGAVAASTFLADTSDANGKASARVVLGGHAGTTRVIVRVPALGLLDTATFTVTPGALQALTIAPSDTTVYVGGAFAVRATGTDRLGNAQIDPVILSRPSGPIVVSGGDTVRAQTYGVASVVAAAGTVIDTLRVTVVPSGALAALAGYSIVLFNLDGSGYRTLATGTSGYAHWSPSGSRLVYTVEDVLQSVDTTGAVSQFGQPTSGESFQQFPQFSRDGQWVYFSQVATTSDANTLWRTPGNGAGPAQSVSMSQDAYAPSPSPDGSQLVYVRHAVSGTTALTVLTLSIGVADSLSVSGTLPVWAPTSNQILFVDLSNGVLGIVNSDGSAQRAIGTAGAGYGGGDWSPDGQWVAARNQSTGLIELINVASNQVIPLQYTRGLDQPTWRP